MTAMQRAWERGLPVADVAKAGGSTVSSVYGYSSKLKWKRPAKKATAATVSTKAAPEPSGTKLSGSVRCTCGAMTTYDPCEKCHKPLARKW